MQVTTLHDLQSVIKAARLRQGLTQAQVAELVPVSRKWVSDFERGRTSGDAEVLLRLLAALGITIHVETPPTSSRRNPDAGADVLDDYLEELSGS